MVISSCMAHFRDGTSRILRYVYGHLREDGKFLLFIVNVLGFQVCGKYKGVEVLICWSIL